MLNKWKSIKKVYIQIFNNGVKGISNHLLADKLIPLSPDLMSLDNANKIFMDLPSNPNLPSYNTPIKCSIGKSYKSAASDYNRMSNVDNTSPDRFTLAFLLKSFASFDQLKSGKMVHGQVIKLGFVADTFVMNSLLDYYIHFLQGHDGLGVVGKVFEEMPEKDIVSWNVMISGLVNKFLYYEALLVFYDMLSNEHNRCKPDETTLNNMIKACRFECFLEQGKWLDSYIKENKFALSLPLGNGLIEMFVSFNDLGNAKMVFKSMSKRCIFTWQTMMTGLVNNGFCKETLMLFDIMCCCCSVVEEGGLKPNDDIFSSVLKAFDEEERLVGDGERLFKVIHKIVHGFGVKPNKDHYELMIIIIAKAGWVEAAMMLAESLPWKPNEYVWAYVLYACQIHRYGDDLLLDSWIKKNDDVKKSKQKDHFMRSTIEIYMRIMFERKPNNDVSYAVLMVESLLRKLSDRHVLIRSDDLELLDELYNELDYTIEENSTPDEGPEDYSAVHAQERLHTYEDDVYKALESLDRQLLFDLHDQMINIVDDPCQLAIYY